MIGAQNNLAITQVFRGDYEKAEKNFLEAIPLLKDTSNLRVLDLKVIQYSNLSDVYQKMGKYEKSVEMLRESHTLHNLYKERKLHEEVTKIEARYSKEKSDLEVQEREQKMTSWIIILSSILLAFILIGIVVYRNYRLKTKT